MNFYRGMRRATIAFWAIVSVILLLIGIFENNDFAAGLGYGIGMVAVWSGIYWVAVFIIRWIWIGFFGEQKQP